jgi:signal peptidase II
LTRLLLAAACVALLDQSSKLYATKWFMEGVTLSRRPWLRLLCVRNDRAGAWLARKPHLSIAIWFAALAATVLLTLWRPLSHPDAAALAMGMALGGAGSNLLDRLFRHAVVDLIDVGVWPVFNLADAAIVSGVLLTLWSVR